MIRAVRGDRQSLVRRYGISPKLATRIEASMSKPEIMELYLNRIFLGNGAYGLYSQLRSWVGTENISYLFYDDPALVAEMIEWNTEFLLALIDRARISSVCSGRGSCCECRARGSRASLSSSETFCSWLYSPTHCCSAICLASSVR